MKFRLTFKDQVISVRSVSVRGAKQIASGIIKRHASFDRRSLGYNPFRADSENWREVAYGLRWLKALPRIGDDKIVRSAELRKLRDI